LLQPTHGSQPPIRDETTTPSKRKPVAPQRSRFKPLSSIAISMAKPPDTNIGTKTIDRNILEQLVISRPISVG